MLKSYKKNHKTSGHFDTIMIGSGIGSLTAAALLAKEGKRVLVLERHYTAGGFTHVFKRKGYEWDVGIHYIGEVSRPHSIIRKLFDYISDGKLKWADMGDVYDKILIGDKSYDLVKGVTKFKEKLISYFPEEEKAIIAYVDLVFKANKTSKNFYLEKAMPPLVSKISGNYMRSPYLKYSSKTTREVLLELTQNEDLIKVLTGQYGDYGLPPSKSSFMMHVSVVKHYFSGGSFPIGGSSRIVECIVPILSKTDSSILISAEVDEIILEKNKAVGVRMADGKEFYADNVISGAGLFTTYEKLLPKGLFEKHKLGEQLQKVSPSVSHVCLYIGLKGSPQELELPKTNYWIYPGENSHDENFEAFRKDIDAEFPVVYISFPSAKDPDWPNRYPDRSTIDIISLMPYEAVKQWEESDWMKRGEDYDAFKEKFAQRLLEALFKQLPHLRGKVDHYELSTPLTTKHFVNYDKGEIYGLDHSPERFNYKFLRPHTPIKNLYLTGQDIVSAGVGAALFSGLITAGAMTGKNFLKKVMTATYEE